MAESFFLEPDEAKSLGNLDYMRTRKKVRKTFPTTKGWGAGFASEVEVAAIEDSFAASNGSLNGSVNGSINGSVNGSMPTVEPVQSEAEEAAPTTSERRRSASDLDMFRNMAKDIRKKG